ncbi:hypothetical protein FOA52_012140 [Chlamydomonas sp. UWO 241]|nr:hypothetical protein FOA52_012140 [Chlamydomonas sp. UWO 241]
MASLNTTTRGAGARLAPSRTTRLPTALWGRRVSPQPSPPTAAPAATKPHGRATSLVVRADLNWDAFRASAERTTRGGWDRESRSVAAQLGGRLAGSGPVKQFDYVVIGSGIAGLTYALKVAAHGSVAIVTKDEAKEGCTQYAQGGVCAVLDPADSVEEHVHDTMVAGGFLNDLQAVDAVCREGPTRVLELAQLGAEFTRNADGTMHLGMEGGHSKRRIVHANDMSGAEISRALLAKARAHPSIHFFEHHLATDLVLAEHDAVTTVFGSDVVDQRDGSSYRFLALATMLACGGAGQMYPITTNPGVATGDGIAMAYRAGASVSNLEFIQFHPTALFTAPSSGSDSDDGQPPGCDRTFLITEALRGEGARLFNLHGERFMASYDERLELAPRDIVARAINHQMRMHGHDHVLLDISHMPADATLSHFPGVAARCALLGIDITRDPIPVAPAQHYTCGGVVTGLLGETTMPGLYACGEVACSGLHGANRLASNSLLEGLVFGERAVLPSVTHAHAASATAGRALHHAAASFRGGGGGSGGRSRPLPPSLSAWVSAKRSELRGRMWAECGIVRRVSELRECARYCAGVQLEARAVLANCGGRGGGGVSTEALELLNLATCAGLVASSALQRRESRGGHYVLDHPEPVEDQRVPTVLTADAPWPATSVDGAPAVAGVFSLLGVGAGAGSSGAPVGVSGSKPGTQGSGGGSAPGSPSKKKGSKARELAIRALPQSDDRKA